MTQLEAIEALGLDASKAVVNNDGTVSYKGNILIAHRKLEKLPVQFKEVTGDFICSYLGLTTLEGCPEKVGGDFSCTFNRITSLKGCPQVVGGSFLCLSNRLTSLSNGPKKVGGELNCSLNQIKHTKRAASTAEGGIVNEDDF